MRRVFTVCAVLIFLSGCVSPGRVYDGQLVWDLPQKFGFIPYLEEADPPKEGGDFQYGSPREPMIATDSTP